MLCDAFKPCGVLGVVERRAKPGSTLKQSDESGHMSEAYIIERATATGFKLNAKSEINHNPIDTKDYAKGVWTFSPVLALGETHKANYRATGESERMTQWIIKPAKLLEAENKTPILVRFFGLSCSESPGQYWGSCLNKHAAALRSYRRCIHRHPRRTPCEVSFQLRHLDRAEPKRLGAHATHAIADASL